MWKNKTIFSLLFFSLAIFGIQRRTQAKLCDLRKIPCENRDKDSFDLDRGQVDVPAAALGLCVAADQTLAVEAGQRASRTHGPDRPVAAPRRSAHRNDCRHQRERWGCVTNRLRCSAGTQGAWSQKRVCLEIVRFTYSFTEMDVKICYSES